MIQGGNSAENKMAAIIEVQEKCQTVYHAIEQCATSMLLNNALIVQSNLSEQF